jgi:hypothetical protein
MIFELFILSNDTIRVLLTLNDLSQNESINHTINFNKHNFNNGAFYTELIRFKEFFFNVQIEMASFDEITNSVICTTLS